MVPLMSAVEKVEKSVRQLTPEQLVEFSRWFEQYIADKWDRQIEADAGAGKLDPLAEKALKEYDAGECRRFP
jgi:hypothetical protein